MDREYSLDFAFPPAIVLKLLLDYMMSSVAQDPILDGEEKSGDKSHQSMPINAGIGKANNPPRQEVEYVTGWRFVAVGIAIVLSMFLVRHHLKTPRKPLSQQADTFLGFLRSGKTFTPAGSSQGPDSGCELTSSIMADYHLYSDPSHHGRVPQPERCGMACFSPVPDRGSRAIAMGQSIQILLHQSHLLG